MHIADVADRSSVQARRVSEEVRKLLKTGDAIHRKVCPADQCTMGKELTLRVSHVKAIRTVTERIMCTTPRLIDNVVTGSEHASSLVALTQCGKSRGRNLA